MYFCLGQKYTKKKLQEGLDHIFTRKTFRELFCGAPRFPRFITPRYPTHSSCNAWAFFGRWTFPFGLRCWLPTFCPIGSGSEYLFWFL